MKIWWNGGTRREFIAEKAVCRRTFLELIAIYSVKVTLANLSLIKIMIASNANQIKVHKCLRHRFKANGLTPTPVPTPVIKKNA